MLWWPSYPNLIYSYVLPEKDRTNIHTTSSKIVSKQNKIRRKTKALYSNRDKIDSIPLKLFSLSQHIFLSYINGNSLVVHFDTVRWKWHINAEMYHFAVICQKHGRPTSISHYFRFFYGRSMHHENQPSKQKWNFDSGEDHNPFQYQATLSYLLTQSPISTITQRCLNDNLFTWKWFHVWSWYRFDTHS